MPRLSRASSQKGFALVATIWLLAIIAVAAGAFAAWVSTSLSNAWSDRQSVTALIEMHGTRDTVLFIAATQPMNSGGLALPPEDGPDARRALATRRQSEDPFTSFLPPPSGSELSLAGRPYEGLGSIRFALQDEAGLLNPNTLERPRLDRLLGLLDVDPGERGPLLDKLADFITQGDLRSLHGANTADYLELGLPQPPDRYLLSGMEALRILDWHRHPGLWQAARWREYVTVTEFGGININTAPTMVLQTDPFIDQDDAQLLITERRRQPFYTPEDAARRTGLPLGTDIFAFSTAPSRHFRFTLWRESATQGLRYHVRLTPQAERGAPWDLDHSYPVDRYGLKLDEPARSIDSPLFATQAHPGNL